MGKFAWDFPNFEHEKRRYVRVAFATVRGSIQMPDENFFQIGRDEEDISWRASEEEARLIINKISKDKKNVENKKFYFKFWFITAPSGPLKSSAV